mmetsp:Transcript_42374/g.78995  ORF Transcript_42374/g.78995 Transcript_42374/m.78995 type:complete len:221 (-) Transcript_42374:180-842(-)
MLLNSLGDLWMGLLNGLKNLGKHLRVASHHGCKLCKLRIASQLLQSFGEGLVASYSRRRRSREGHAARPGTGSEATRSRTWLWNSCHQELHSYRGVPTSGSEGSLNLFARETHLAQAVHRSSIERRRAPRRRCRCGRWCGCRSRCRVGSRCRRWCRSSWRRRGSLGLGGHSNDEAGALVPGVFDGCIIHQDFALVDQLLAVCWQVGPGLGDLCLQVRDFV